MMKEVDSKIIQILRLPLTIAVIYIHLHVLTHEESALVNGSQINLASFTSLSGVELLYMLRYVFASVIARIAVPTFFLFAGYLMYQNTTRDTLWDNYKRKISKRKTSLIYPYIIWNVLMLLPVTLISFIKKEPLNQWFISNANIDIIYKTFWAYVDNSPLNFPLWFCRDLIVLSLLSPLLYLLLSNKKWYFLVILTALYAIYPFGPQIFPSFFSLFFYSLGLYFGINGKSLTWNNKIGNYFIYLINIASFLFCVLYHHSSIKSHLFEPIFVTTGVFVAFHIVSKCTSEENSFLVRKSHVSFFIYACHAGFILPAFGVIRESEIITNIYGRVLFFLVVPIITMYIGIFYYDVLKRINVPLAKLLSGGR